MIKIFKIGICLLALCLGSNFNGRPGAKYGELRSRKGSVSKNSNYTPCGMTLIPSGSFYTGSYEDRSVGIYEHNTLTGVNDFFMDTMPISNYQYADFLEYVEKHKKYGHVEFLDKDSLKSFSKVDRNVEYKDLNKLDNKDISYNSISQVDDEMEEDDDDIDDDDIDDDDIGDDDEFESEINSKKFSESEDTEGIKKSGQRKIVNKENISDDSEEELLSEKLVKKIYFKGFLVSPDPFVWRNLTGCSEFTNSFFLDVLAQEYHCASAYSCYPVVCISWQAASMFVDFRNMRLRNYLKKEKVDLPPSFRLPTDVEYSYAQRGGYLLPRFSFGGPYARGKDGALLCNFKSKSNMYGECGFLGPSPSGLFKPNGYGLYDMSGNVACWLSNTCIKKNNSGDCTVVHYTMGGSWADLFYYCQVGVLYERDGMPDPRIGFRCVMSCVGV